METTIRLDAGGRLVLPKALRERLNLRTGARLRADVVAGHLELVPVAAEERPALRKKSGITVLAKTGAKADAATAVVAEREDMLSTRRLGTLFQAGDAPPNRRAK